MIWKILLSVQGSNAVRTLNRAFDRVRFNVRSVTRTGPEVRFRVRKNCRRTGLNRTSATLAVCNLLLPGKFCNPEFVSGHCNMLLPCKFQKPESGICVCSLQSAAPRQIPESGIHNLCLEYNSRIHKALHSGLHTVNAEVHSTSKINIAQIVTILFLLHIFLIFYFFYIFF